MILKYIVIKNFGAVLFPEAVSHNKVGLALANAEEIESAGFAVIENGKCVGVFGKAVSMNGLPNLSGDEHVINDSLFNPVSNIKYYNASTQSVREEGIATEGKNKPKLLLLNIPEGWSEQDIKRFGDAWKDMVQQPGKVLEISFAKGHVAYFDDLNVKKKRSGIGLVPPPDFPFPEHWGDIGD